MIKYEGKKVVVIFDVDGVLTKGNFFYDKKNGKVLKEFGPDDAHALKLIKNDVAIEFVSTDKRGFPITAQRVYDMGFEVTEVGHEQGTRLDWINKNYPKDEWFRIYMGDSFVDAVVFKGVDVGICPHNGSDIAKKYATIITERDGGDRAVAEAVFWIMKQILDEDVEKILGLI